MRRLSANDKISCLIINFKVEMVLINGNDIILINLSKIIYIIILKNTVANKKYSLKIAFSFDAYL